MKTQKPTSATSATIVTMPEGSSQRAGEVALVRLLARQAAGEYIRTLRNRRGTD